MKPYKFTIALFLFSVILSACQKEFLPEQVPFVRKPDSTYIDMVYYIDSSATSNDTFRIISFQYDDDRRVVRQEMQLYSNHLLYGRATKIFYYNGSDSLPFKTYATARSDDRDTLTQFFSYNNEGRKTMDSTYSSKRESTGSYYRIIDVFSFKYEANMVYGVYKQIFAYPENFRDPYTQYDTVTLDIANQPIVMIYDDNQNLPGARGTRLLAYENSRNPFVRLNIFNTLGVASTDNDFLRSYSNISSLTSPGSQPVHFDYTFISGGRVDRRTTIDALRPNLYHILHFTYKTL